MALRILGRPGRKPSWADLRPRLLDAAGPGASVSDDEGLPWVAWHEGPSIATVQAAAGETPGWEWAAMAPDVEVPLPPPSTTPVIWVRRSYSVRALATGLVRFHAAHGRIFTTADQRGRETFARLVDVDDPARSGYPIVDLMVDLLLDRPDPDPQPPTGSAIDDLAGKLRRLGYDNLWAVAYKEF